MKQTAPASKPVIYRRGVVPAGLNVQESSSDDDSSVESDHEEQQRSQQPVKDKRLDRLNSVSKNNVDKHENKEAEESEEDEQEERRAMLRKQALQRRRELEKMENSVAVKSISQETAPVVAASNAKEIEESPSSESSSESEDSESSEEELPRRVLFKPVFVPKVSRDIGLEQEKLAKKEAEAEENRIAEAEKRKVESSELVIDVLRKEAIEAQHQLEHIELDDTDGVDEEQELAAWKIRELLRIKRSKEQREYRLVDAEDIERRRNLSDDQIELENKKDGKIGVEKTKLKFMQKYFHKGAFYGGDEQVEEALHRTDTSAPTLEDHQDKLVLPDVMKVKNFGKAGRTKYTHLVDQDTTGLDTAWAKEENTSQSILRKMGGMKSGFDKPTTKKRKID